MDDTTTLHLAERGKFLIFGERGEGGKTVNIGKAQCSICHAFQPEQPDKRAPNLWGITTRQRNQSTPIEYLAESHVCPSCYIAAGWGFTGSRSCESPMPKVHLPPINLTLEELVAVDTWIYVHEGETPPSPRTIRSTYKNILSKEEWRYITRDTENAKEAESPGKHLFLRHACTGCHIIPGIPGATGKLGPPLYMKEKASMRLSEPAYQGFATSPSDYIVESILDHDLYVVSDNPRYSQHTLPSRYYGNRIKPEELLYMVEYLAEIKQDSEQGHPHSDEAQKCLQGQGS